MGRTATPLSWRKAALDARILSGSGFFIGATPFPKITSEPLRGRTMDKTKAKDATPSRRSVLQGAAATIAAARIGFPGGAFAETAGPETTKAILGYIALTDSAPLIIAKEKGLFAKHGMPDVEVSKQASWGATRDNLVLGGASNGIDGAHILTPMPYLISTGKVTQNNAPTPMYILARLNLDLPGNFRLQRI